MTQCDGFDGTSRVAGYGLLLRDAGVVAHRNALNGVDGRDGIGTGKIAAHGRLVDLGDVGCHLWDDRNGDITLYVCRVESDEFGVLADVGAHAGQSHLGTGEVKLHSITSCAFRHFGQHNPLSLGLSHDGSDDDFGGIIFLQSFQDVEIHAYWVLAQLFHVAETVEVTIVIGVDCIETGRHFVDVLHADGLVENAAPSCLEGTCHHLVVGTDG